MRNKWLSDVSELLLIDAVTVLLILVISFFPNQVLRIVLGLPFLLFFPGYTLIAALFPKKTDLDGIERIALSFGLSIAIVPLIGLILNYTPWGISLYPILISLTIFILAMSIIAAYRRQRMLEGQRFRVSLKIPFPSLKWQSGLDKVLSIVLIVAILGAIGTLAYVIVTPKVGERFTEFYILGPKGKAEDYPTDDLRVGNKYDVILGIVNHEHEEMSYQVEVRLDDSSENVKIWLDTDDDGEADLDEEIVGNIIEVAELEREEKWERRLFFAPQVSGEEPQKLEFRLFSPKLMEERHIRAQLPTKTFVAIEVDEVNGNGEITLENQSDIESHYRLEVWQGETKAGEDVELTVEPGQKAPQEFNFTPGEASFRLYQDGELVLRESSAELSLHLWIIVWGKE